MAAIASRYARALADVVLERKLDPETAVQQVNDMVAAVHQNDQLRLVWESPAVPAEQKRKLLDAIVSRTGTLRPIRNFFAVLIDHRRIPMLAQIAGQFEAELDNQLGFVEARRRSNRHPGQSRRGGGCRRRAAARRCGGRQAQDDGSSGIGDCRHGPQCPQ